MSTTTLNPVKPKLTSANQDVADFIGKLFSFNSSLKLHHWAITGKASYARHMALDQAVASLLDVTDRITETSIAMKGDLEIVIPETKNPENIIDHAENFYKYVESKRELFSEAFTQSVIDDYQEAIQQLLYRLKRLQ